MIGEDGKEVDMCRFQDWLEFQRGEGEVRGTNSRMTKRKREVDTIEVKRGIGPISDAEAAVPTMPPGAAMSAYGNMVRELGSLLQCGKI